LKELQQGVFWRIPNFSQRELHPDLVGLHGDRKRNSVNMIPSRRCWIIASCLSWEMTFFATRHFSRQHKHGRQATRPVRNPKKTHRLQLTQWHGNTKDAYLAIVGIGPESRYDYPPMLEALVRLGFLFEYDKGVFICVRDPRLQRKASALEH
jgi:hypothetical protein